MKVAVLGASADPTRYAHLAMQRLLEHGHEVFGVHPRRPRVEGVTMVADLAELPAGCHTLTLYLGPARSEPLASAIEAYGFTRVIFNPGTENPALQRRLEQHGVEVAEACTLVLLATGRFAP